jgi:hypothetical protein
MEKEKFECAACGVAYDHEMSVHECRVCHRTYCDQCIDEEGLCVPCGEKEKYSD